MTRSWRTVKDLTAELRFPSAHACRQWLRRNRVPFVRRGRAKLIDAIDVDRVLRNEGRRA